MEGIILELIKQSLVGGILFIIVYWFRQDLVKRDDRNNILVDNQIKTTETMVKALESVVTRNSIVMERVERKLDEKTG